MNPEIKDFHNGTFTFRPVCLPLYPFVCGKKLKTLSYLLHLSFVHVCVCVSLVAKMMIELKFLIFEFQVGFVNSLQFSVDGQVLVAGLGQEHKLGRWWRIKEAKNGVRIIRLRKKIH
jgi:hypothetical protein